MKTTALTLCLFAACFAACDAQTDLPEGPMPEGFKAGPRPPAPTPTAEPRMVEVHNGVETIKQAQTCYDFQVFPVPGQCVLWGPTAPAGFSWCAGDNNAYSGELVVFMGVNYTDVCFYAHPGPNLVLNSLGEFDGPYWHISSYKSNMSSWSSFHDLQNQGGQEYPILPGWNQKPNVPAIFGWSPSSLNAHN